MDPSGNKNLIIGFVIGLVLGVLVGMVLFWGLFPVKWTDAQTYHLTPEARAEYMGLVADSFALTKDPAITARFVAVWNPEEKEQAVAGAMLKYQTEGQPDKVQRVQDLAMVLGIPLPTEAPLEPSEPEPPATGIWDRLRIPCLVFLLVLLALVLGLLGIRGLLRRRASAESPASRPQQPPPGARVEPVARGAPVPVGTFVTTYQLGEDSYDESFSIEGPSGEFLGECGMGISETIGVGEPDKVAAFELWLFDKSDIRTITKVLMSEYTYRDDAFRAKLASKGEAVLAQPGSMINFETSGLKVQAVVSELQYGVGDLPTNSYFARLVVELETMAKLPARGTG